MAKRVQFTDLSKPGDDGPITAWDWDFGDGSPHSNLQNPYHDYTSSGTYFVKLTVTGSGNDGTDDVTHNLAITIPVPVADFDAVVTGLSVAFTDNSEPGPSGPITNYAWDFGDGTTGGTGGGGGGSFPSTGVLDNFDSYTAGGLNARGNWLAPMGGAGSGLWCGTNFAHTINPTLNNASAYLTPNYGPDCEVYADIVQLDTINPANYMRLIVRCQNPTSATTRSQYQVRCQADGTWKIEKVINNSTTVLGTYTQAVQNGDKFGLSIVGQTLKAWWYDGSGDHAWHLVGTVDDNASDKITAAGKIAVWLQGTATEQMITLDNLGGGTYVPGGGGDPANPTHVYATAGSYDVKLTVTGTGDDGVDDITKNVVAVAPAQLTAIFTTTRSGALVGCHDYSTPGPSGPITAYDWDYGDGSTHGTTQNPTHMYAASGTYTIRLTVTGTGADGTATVTHSVDVVVPPPSGGTIFEQFIAASDFARPTFTPTRTVRFKDKAGLDAAIIDLRAGDLVKYDPASFGLEKKPLVISASGTAYSIRNKQLSGRAVIDFGCSHNVWDNTKIVPDFVSFVSTGVKSDAFFFADNKNVDIWGGDYKGRGSGFRLQGAATDCQFLDLYCHDIGLSGVMMQPANSSTGASVTIDGVVVRAEINRFCLDAKNDAHLDRGTGAHGAIHHANGGHLDNCHFYYYAHDSLRPGETSMYDGTVYPEGGGGSACEPGTDWSTKVGEDHSYTSQNNNHYCVYGENLLMLPKIPGVRVNPGGDATTCQTGGNVIDNWGAVPMNGNVFDFVGGKNCTGAVMHGAGGNWGLLANPQIKVLVGRGENTNQYVGPGGNTAERYVSGKNIDYVDCT